MILIYRPRQFPIDVLGPSRCRERFQPVCSLPFRYGGRSCNANYPCGSEEAVDPRRNPPYPPEPQQGVLDRRTSRNKAA